MLYEDFFELLLFSNGFCLAVVDYFTYLGRYRSNDSSIGLEVTACMNKARVVHETCFICDGTICFCLTVRV